MNYRPNPLLYGANEDFYSNFKLVISMTSAVDVCALARSVALAMKRYPYFSVRPVACGEQIVLQSNPLPVAVFPDDRCVVLGSKQCNGHLIAFGCEGNRIFLNASHFIADGMGILPVLKTVLYLYVRELYGASELKSEDFALPEDAVGQEEYQYPFPDHPFALPEEYLPRSVPRQVYTLNPDAFDGEGFYAYHLRVPQKEMMAKANPSDGSPISYFSVMLYRALCALDEGLDRPVCIHVQHQYRSVLRLPQNRHSLVSYLPAVLSVKAKGLDVERQNTVLRGQIILGVDGPAEQDAINRMLCAFPQEESLSKKQQAMRRYVEQSIENKTFGISYVGKMDWSGLERYMKDIHVYIGEKNSRSMLLMEVMTLGEDFSLTFMQSGRGRSFVDAFAHQLRSNQIPVSLVGEERYTLCDVRLSL